MALRRQQRTAPSRATKLGRDQDVHQAVPDQSDRAASPGLCG
jgi:hypothetical protein